MSKIIQDPSRLINSFTASFGEDHRETFERVFSQYISDAVIAVTPEDIAAQAIAWANCEVEFTTYYSDIDINDDDRRYTFVQERLIEDLDIKAIVGRIEKDWDVNSSTTAIAIQEAIFSVHTAASVLEMVIDADAENEAEQEANNNA